MKLVNPGPRERLPIIRPSINTTNEREAHQALIKMKSENSIIARHKQATLHLSLGNQVMLKSPTMHQGKFHQLSKPTILEKPYIPIKIRAINTHKSPRKMTFNVFEGNNHGELPHTC
jgi:hypothetical protein